MEELFELFGHILEGIGRSIIGFFRILGGAAEFVFELIMHLFESKEERRNRRSNRNRRQNRRNSETEPED